MSKHVFRASEWGQLYHQGEFLRETTHRVYFSNPALLSAKPRFIQKSESLLILETDAPRDAIKAFDAAVKITNVEVEKQAEVSRLADELNRLKAERFQRAIAAARAVGTPVKESAA